MSLLTPFERARSAVSSGRRFINAGIPAAGNVGPAIPVRNMTGDTYSLGTALAQIGIKILARRRADANYEAALRHQQLSEDFQRSQIALMDAKANTPPKAPAIKPTMDVTDDSGNTYPVPPEAALRYRIHREDLQFKAAHPPGRGGSGGRGGIAGVRAAANAWATAKTDERMAQLEKYHGMLGDPAKRQWAMQNLGIPRGLDPYYTDPKTHLGLAPAEQRARFAAITQLIAGHRANAMKMYSGQYMADHLDEYDDSYGGGQRGQGGSDGISPEGQSFLDNLKRSMGNPDDQE